MISFMMTLIRSISPDFGMVTMTLILFAAAGVVALRQVVDRPAVYLDPVS